MAGPATLKRPATLENIVNHPAVAEKIERVVEDQYRRNANGGAVGLNGEAELEKFRIRLQKQQLAMKFAQGIESHFHPFAWFIGRNLARLAVGRSYKKVVVEASEKTLEAIVEGSVLMFSTHSSYFDIGVLPRVFEMLRNLLKRTAHKSKPNVYIVAGANVSDVALVENEQTVFVDDKIAATYIGWEHGDKIIRGAVATKNYLGRRVVSLKNYFVDRIVDPHVNQPARKGLGWLLRNSGTIYVKRKSDLRPTDRDSLILGEVFSAYLQGLLKQGDSVVSFFGNGRQKSGEIMPLQFMANEETLATAKYIVTVTITYETIPKREENDFAKHIREEAEAASAATEKKRRGATFFYALTLPKWLRAVNPFIPTYGIVHIVFSEPIPTAEYFHGKIPSKQEYAALKRDLLELAVSNVTLTPKSAVATAIGILGNERLTVSALEKEVDHLVKVAAADNIRISEKLTGAGSYRQEVSRAIDYFAARKALKVSIIGDVRVTDPALLTYYANTVKATLSQKIQQARA